MLLSIITLGENKSKGSKPIGLLPLIRNFMQLVLVLLRNALREADGSSGADEAT